MRKAELKEAERLAEVAFWWLRRYYKAQSEPPSYFEHKGQMFEQCGAGFYADVWWPVGKPYVIKISGAGLWRGDWYDSDINTTPDPWQYFVQSTRHIKSTYLPKVHLYKQVSERLALAIIERLFPMQEEDARVWTDHLSYCIDEERGPGWFRELQALFDPGWLCWDLHSGNMMRRKNGQRVLTDPFCLA